MVKLETLRNLDLLIVNVREHSTEIGAYQGAAQLTRASVSGKTQS
jgi:hypothetical protein